jgi:tetratricopeptide (TPR) repeat protein
MKSNQVIKKFILNSQILIADKCIFSRKRLEGLLCQHGAKSENIFQCSNPTEAKEILSNQNVVIVFLEFELDGFNAFDLRKMFYKDANRPIKRMFILTTSNGNKNLILKSSEEEMDFILLKPFDENYFVSSFSELITRISEKTSYMDLIQEAVILIAKNEFTTAREVLSRALKMDDKPVLAYYYLGKIDKIDHKFKAAIKNFSSGLSFDNTHYKTLKSLFEIYYKTESYEDAYEVGKKIAFNFPSTPEELENIIRLTVMTKNFQEMTIFHEMAKASESKDLLLLNYIGSGLYVTGKYYLFLGMTSQALECYERLANTCLDQPKFICAIIHSLIDTDHITEAEKFLDFLKNAPTDLRISKFLIECKKTQDPKLMIEAGVKLMEESSSEYLVLALSDIMMRAGRPVEEINDLKKHLLSKAS